MLRLLIDGRFDIRLIDVSMKKGVCREPVCAGDYAHSLYYENRERGRIRGGDQEESQVGWISPFRKCIENWKLKILPADS